MNKEYLLDPKTTKKWEVIASYPSMLRNHNIKSVGDVLSDDGKVAVRDQRGNAIVAIEFKDFPHIFKALGDG